MVILLDVDCYIGIFIVQIRLGHTVLVYACRVKVRIVLILAILKDLLKYLKSILLYNIVNDMHVELRLKQMNLRMLLILLFWIIVLFD